MKSLVVSPRPTDALSFYRCIGPLRRLRETHPFDFTQNSSLNWAVMAEYDNTFLHRPYTPEHVKIMDIAKNYGIKIWGDYDDWLLDLEYDNPAKGVFDSAKKDILHCKKNFDLLFVTTQRLKELCEGVGATNVVVAPNAYDHRLFPYARQKKAERTKICLWRGSNTHNQDLKSIMPALEKVIQENTDWQFVFVAYNPSWMMSQKYSNVHYIGPKETLEYMRMIWEIAPLIMYHPLHDNDFNRSKSMCSWLEASHAGAAFVGPDFEEYSRPGIVKYQPGNSDSFYDAMSGLIKSKDAMINSIQDSAKYIHENLTLDHVNKIRWKALSQLQTKQR